MDQTLSVLCHLLDCQTVEWRSQAQKPCFCLDIKNDSKKAKDIISEKGSRTVLRTVKERVFQALQDASKTTKDVIALQSDDVTKRAESEEWLDNLQSEVKDIVDSIEEVFRKPWR